MALFQGAPLEEFRFLITRQKLNSVSLILNIHRSGTTSGLACIFFIHNNLTSQLL